MLDFTPNSFWRVQSEDGVWHMVSFHMFHYYEVRNENKTYCGLTLNNPPFVDLTPNFIQMEFKEEPVPKCDECITKYYLSQRDRAISWVRHWSEKVRGSNG